MFHGVFLATLTLAILTLVSASLYPIQPIQNTVYYAGETALTRWIEDGSFPLLSDMGGITIQLYCDDDTYLATLATNVSPAAKYCQLDIPRKLVHDSSNFTFRYITDTPYNTTIYSADFTIVVPGDSFLSSQGSISTSTSGNLFFQATTSQPLSLSPSSSTSSVVSGGSMPSSTSIVIPPLRPGDIGNIDQPSGNSKSSAAGRIDIEKLKFRVVFILWPALLGVTMAL
ncbi:uncharacterized protein EDB91DRAFT_1348938 [Suillus paluster]|uniref:uncharacterized protein n=1 Tax=Suillus paluster TaxID=48578 RepID=UPI001B8664C6|nr:uncharacterized protein EDB91DRAFT_1348938 [Suillus paluster]KAG1732847.1 hypothetical protein EDB91DRAFT_1348938 [Suillus paluster]